jgi:hypothetical protein
MFKNMKEYDTIWKVVVWVLLGFIEVVLNGMLIKQKKSYYIYFNIRIGTFVCADMAFKDLAFALYSKIE